MVWVRTQLLGELQTNLWPSLEKSEKQANLVKCNLILEDSEDTFGSNTALDMLLETVITLS